ncbi:MAG: hypothetical protein RBG13Loki_2489 [Promethearchaeota archaeon CR_4]|nr:MAG: hypothetical protein RBG13Loki_2489 [Candidatus Lokiarchaeota archaeon CR_4]
MPTKILIDTSVLIGILRKLPSCVDKYATNQRANTRFYISTFTIAEVYEGFYARNVFEKKEIPHPEYQVFARLFDKMNKRRRIVTLNPESSMFYAKLLHLLKSAGNFVPIMDVLIAAVGYVSGHTIATGDRRHFETMREVYPDLNVDFWSTEKE